MQKTILVLRATSTDELSKLVSVKKALIVLIYNNKIILIKELVEAVSALINSRVTTT